MSEAVNRRPLTAETRVHGPVHVKFLWTEWDWYGVCCECFGFPCQCPFINAPYPVTRLLPTLCNRNKRTHQQVLQFATLYPLILQEYQNVNTYVGERTHCA